MTLWNFTSASIFRVNVLGANGSSDCRSGTFSNRNNSHCRAHKFVSSVTVVVVITESTSHQIFAHKKVSDNLSAWSGSCNSFRNFHLFSQINYGKIVSWSVWRWNVSWNTINVKEWNFVLLEVVALTECELDCVGFSFGCAVEVEDSFREFSCMKYIDKRGNDPREFFWITSRFKGSVERYKLYIVFGKSFNAVSSTMLQSVVAEMLKFLFIFSRFQLTQIRNWQQWWLDQQQVQEVHRKFSFHGRNKLTKSFERKL